MFFRKDSSNKQQIIEKVKKHQMKPSFIENNIVIPNMINRMNTIALLFKEMKEIYNQLQNKNSEFSQEFIKNLETMMIDYNMQRCLTSDPIKRKQIEEEKKMEQSK